MTDLDELILWWTDLFDSPDNHWTDHQYAMVVKTIKSLRELKELKGE